MKHYNVLSGEGRALLWLWTGTLSVASFVATALVMGELFSGSFAQDVDFLGYIIGAGLDLAKLSLMSILLVSVWRKELAKAGAVSILAIPLLIASVSLSVTFMSDTVDANIQAQTQASQSNSIVSDQIEVVDSQIASQRESLSALQAQFRSNTEANYRQMNQGVAEQIAETESRIDGLLKRRADLSSKLEASAPAAGDIKVYGLDQSTLQMIILLAAILVDAAAVGGSAMIYNDRLVRSERDHELRERERLDRIKFGNAQAHPAPSKAVQEAPVAPVSREAGEISVQPKQVATPAGSEEYETAVELVYQKGIKPSIKSLREAGMSAKKAKNGLAQMYEHGLITKTPAGHYTLPEQV